MIFPSFPKSGDTIGVCAPSAGMGESPERLESFDLSLETLRSLGYTITETSSVRSADNPSSDPLTRGREFNELFEDENIILVFAATGGEYNYDMLPYINTDIVQAHPKWFAGYSDPTNIDIFLTTKYDIATIYGVNAGAFDWRPLHRFQENALEIIQGHPVEQHSFEYWDSNRDFDKAGYVLDTPVSWDLYLPGTDIPAGDTDFNVSGRLIGGCTEVLDQLFGTPYEDIKGFIDRYRNDGFIWYLDTFETDPVYLYLKLLKMKEAGWFDGAQAIIVGRVMFPGEHTDEEYIESLKKVFSDIPFIWGADIGHTKPSMTVINGAIGHLSCKNSAASLSMELK